MIADLVQAAYPNDQRKPMHDRRLAIGAAIVLLVNALVLFVIFPPVLSHLGSNYHSNLFPDEYDLIAQNLVRGLGYRVYPDTSLTMLRSPGFILVLAAIFAAFGKSLLAVQIIQFLMSAATAVLVYLISRRLLSSQPVSLIAAAVFLFHPVTMVAETRGGDDITLILFLTLTLWLLLRSLDSRSPRDFVLLGAVFGYTMLVKPSVALVLPAAATFLLFWPGSGFRPLALIRNFAIAGAVAAIVMAPWVARNYEISGKFVPSMTVGGLAIFQGVEVVKHSGNGEANSQLLQDAADKQIRVGHEMGLRMKDDFYPQFYKVRDEIRFYNELGQRAWVQYRTSPLLLVRAIFHNGWAFWLQGRTHRATLLDMIIMVPFLAVSIFGAWRAVRLKWKCWILIVCGISFMAPNLVIIAVDRHCSSLIPVMSIFFACALLPKAITRFEERHSLVGQLQAGQRVTAPKETKRIAFGLANGYVSRTSVQYFQEILDGKTMNSPKSFVRAAVLMLALGFLSSVIAIDPVSKFAQDLASALLGWGLTLLFISFVFAVEAVRRYSRTRAV